METPLVNINMCLNPILINSNGRYKETNYNGLKGEEYNIKVFAKCGRCSQCMNDKANNWVIRNYYESQCHDKKAFICLTYKDNPKILVKKHLQNFIKRLRYYVKNKIKYFACGEYGSLKNRPHYHVIIYGWEEEKENIKYLGLSKKGYPIFQSNTIQNAWGLGRTTYQIFDSNEIPYISLYQTAQEEMKRAYMSSKEKTKNLIKELKKDKNILFRKDIINELSKAIKEAEENKRDYIMVKEFNLWSIALGYKKWYEEYSKGDIYDFKEYIKDKEFQTPTPWVKKVANFGEINAIKEMKRRTAFVSSSETLEQYKNKNLSKKNDQIKNDRVKWVEEKEKLTF